MKKILTLKFTVKVDFATGLFYFSFSIFIKSKEIYDSHRQASLFTLYVRSIHVDRSMTRSVVVLRIILLFFLFFFLQPGK